jgi:predicted nucleic acid-binding Zn ribbon protein
MERLGDGVKRELARFGAVEGMVELVECWPRAAGAEIARNAWPARLARDGTLHISTASAAWAFELAHLEGRLLTRLTEELAGPAPKRLRFAVGRLPEPAHDPAKESRRPSLRPAPGDVERARSLTSGIESSELRERIARAAAASLARGTNDRSVW